MNDRNIQSLDLELGIVLNKQRLQLSSMSITSELDRGQPKPGSGRRRPPRTPKGRQVDLLALEDIRGLLGNRPRRRDPLAGARTPGRG